MWFANCVDEGIVYASYFDPLSVKMIALVLAVVSLFAVLYYARQLNFTR
jgi:hypothetical protein